MIRRIRQNNTAQLAQNRQRTTGFLRKCAKTTGGFGVKSAELRELFASDGGVKYRLELNESRAT